MGLFEIIVVFVITWWLAFFITLPFGVRGQYEDGEVTPGTEEGAPSNPDLKRKAIWASLGAAGATAVVFISYSLFLGGR